MSKFAISWRSVDGKGRSGRMKNEREIAVPKRRGNVVLTGPVLLCISSKRFNGAKWVSGLSADATRRTKVLLELNEPLLNDVDNRTVSRQKIGAV